MQTEYPNKVVPIQCQMKLGILQERLFSNGRMPQGMFVEGESLERRKRPTRVSWGEKAIPTD